MLFAWVDREPFDLLVWYTTWLHDCKQYSKFASMVPKVVTLAEAHDGEGVFLKPLLDLVDGMTETVSTGDRTDGEKEAEGEDVEGIRAVSDYMVAHVTSVCSDIGKVALHEKRMGALRSLLKVLEVALADA